MSQPEKNDSIQHVRAGKSPSTAEAGFQPDGLVDPKEVNLFVARKLRQYRRDAGLTLTELSAILGNISFQQLQKYESGTNRISSSRLFQIASLFGTPVSRFFPPTSQHSSSALKFSEDDEKLVEQMLIDSSAVAEVKSLIADLAEVEDHDQLCQLIEALRAMVSVYTAKITDR